MNSSCRPSYRRWIAGLALAAAALAASPAAAIQISAVYSAACQREVGVILHVDDASIQLLNLDGEIRTHFRFDIIYLAHYPLAALPISLVSNPGAVEAVTIRTLHQGEIADLARGWLIDFSDVEMSLLTLEGREAVVHLDDLWDVEFSELTQPVEFQGTGGRFSFVHPYPFRFCAPDDTGAAAATPRTVYPQQLLADPVQIKNELDRLMEGHERLDEFARSKVFYPVPRVYGNDTLLGLWLNAGARHGASRSRHNSLTPALTSELSEGPFSFQRVLVAGAAPMRYSVHEEVQTQLYYRLKADYVHFSANYDLSRALIGESRYKWRREELASKDDRWNELSHVAGGFDYDGFAADISATSFQYAFRSGSLFFREHADMAKFGILYQSRRFYVDAYYGLAFDGKPEVEEIAEGTSDEDVQDAEDKLKKIPDFFAKFRLYRLNAGLTRSGANAFDYSLIFRTAEFQRLKDLNGNGEFRYQSESLTNSIYWTHALDEELSLIGTLSVEDVRNRAGSDRLGGATHRTYPKAGIGLQLRL